MRWQAITGTVFATAMATTGVAFAASSGTYPNLVTTGATLAKISWSFDRNAPSAGFNYSGNLKDTLADGNAPFVHAKTDGYDYATRIYNNKGAGTSLSVSQKVYDANGDPAQSAVIEVCRDRGTLYPDNCATSSRIYR